MTEGPLTKKCPYCAEQILTDAVKCKHCGEWLTSQSVAHPAEPVVPSSSPGDASAAVAVGPARHPGATEAPWLGRLAGSQQVGAVIQYSNSQPTKHLVALSVATFGLYQIYWLYRNWKQLNTSLALGISAGWRTAGLLVPILNIWLVYDQFRTIARAAARQGCKGFSPGWVLVFYLSLGLLWRLPGLFSFLSVASVGPLVIVQDTLNCYWKKTQPGLPQRMHLTSREVGIVAVGGIVWILAITAVVMGWV